MFRIAPLFPVVCLLLWAEALPAQAFQLPFTPNQPDRNLKLAGDLDEISGLSLAPDGRQLVAVQDEDGIIYWLDPTTGEITAEKEFWKEGDYEGIETIGQDIWVLKSTGTLYRVTNWNFDQPAVNKFNGPLTKDNDVEGLGYLPGENRLLLACKEIAGVAEANYPNTRVVYAFDPGSDSFSPEPRFVISRAAILAYLQANPRIENYAKVCEFYQRKELDLSPSAIAMDPVSGNGYLLSSVGKFLLVFQPDGQVLHIHKLDKDIYAQPEAICFDAAGNLFIASEAKDGPARLLYLKRQR